MVPGTDFSQLFAASAAIAGNSALFPEENNVLLSIIPGLTISIGILVFGSLLLTKFLKRIL